MNVDVVNTPFSNSHGWTGSSMKWRLMRANLFKCKFIARISLHFMLDPVQPLEYETGLFLNVGNFHITVDVFSDSDSGKCDLSVTSSEIPPLNNERLAEAGQLRKFDLTLMIFLGRV